MNDIVILKPGFKPEEVPFEMKCNTCGCEFRLSLKNMRLAIMPDENYYWVNCPSCSRALSVSVEDIYSILKDKRIQTEKAEKDREEYIKQAIETATKIYKGAKDGSGEDNGQVSDMVE